ncbi:MAG: hypothetical protein JO189_07520 [Deltaproteobacteria bacterium]|nr:hypothetical protein [Deltaproteobacteria bacterium]
MRSNCLQAPGVEDREMLDQARLMELLAAEQRVGGFTQGRLWMGLVGLGLCLAMSIGYSIAAWRVVLHLD